MIETQEQLTAIRVRVKLDHFYDIIRACDAKGDHTVQKLAMMTQTKKCNVIARLREKKFDLPADIDGMPWVHRLMEINPKFVKRPIRYGPPVANATVKSGAAQQIAVLKGKEQKRVSLPPLPRGLHVKGADQWGIIVKDGVRP